MISTESILKLVAPYDCLVCKMEGDVMCARCLERLPPLVAQQCLLCGMANEDDPMCSDCTTQTRISSLCVRTSYVLVARDLVYAMKFGQVRQGCEVIGREMAKMLPDGPYVVTYVPTAGSRRRQRGYDQAELIARSIGRCKGWEYRSLLRRRGDARQLGSSRFRRQMQAQASFDIIRPSSRSLPSVLLVDDVMTTGASVRACAALLVQHGYRDIVVAVFAHTPDV